MVDISHFDVVLIYRTGLCTLISTVSKNELHHYSDYFSFESTHSIEAIRKIESNNNTQINIGERKSKTKTAKKIGTS